MENWRELVWPAVLFGAVAALGWLARRILFTRLQRSTGSASPRLDSMLIESLHGPLLLWILILAIHLAAEYSDLPRNVTRWSAKLLLTLWILSLTLVLSRFSGRMVRVYSARLEGALPLGTLTEFLASLVIWILGILTLLDQVFELNIRAILAALGVGGLAVALALQDTLSNLFAGFYVSVARQVRIGDFVPNNKLAQSIVTNYNLPDRPLGIGITVPVTYDSDPSQVERLLNEVGSAAVGQVPGLLQKPAPSARFIPGFGKTSMDFTLDCQVAEFADQFLVQHELRKRIYRRFHEEGILFQSPNPPAPSESSIPS
jgi:small-conductance mechanosensitive channel